MQWRQVGPFRGGRALAIEGVLGEPNVWYFGAVAGGVWKTVDGGANWTPLFDKQDISSIGAIAVAPSDHNTVYVGTGEAAIRGNTTYGTGVYKSVDAERTGKISGCAIPARSERSSFIQPTPILFWSPRSATLSARIKSAEFFEPATVEKRGQRFSRKTRTPVGLMSSSIRTIPM